MRVVIDMQGAQTASRFRGIGRYTLAFAKGVVRNRGEHEIFLALSGLFPETIEPIRSAFYGLLPQENIRIWYAPGPTQEIIEENRKRREVAELVREAFLASLKPDIIHICSLFEGYIDDAVTSIGRLDTVTPATVILYDLIPLINPDQYLRPDPVYHHYYERKIESLNRADACFAISDFSRQEGLQYLDFDESNIVNISSAIETDFRPLNITSSEADVLRRKFGLTRPFLFYAGDVDERKNIPRLLQAFAALPSHLRKKYQMLFAGKISPVDMAHLQNHGRKVGLNEDELIFAGYVTDEELQQLYILCHLFVFPSWHEGFGLPALEAMACGAPVIGSNTTSLPEVIGLDSALFDPFDVSSISQKIAQVLQDADFHAELREHGLKQAKLFSWDETARRAISAWEVFLSRAKKKPVLQEPKRKPKLAFVSPLPPERTGIADYSAELLPALAEYYEITIIINQPVVDNPWIKQHLEIRDIAWLRANANKMDRVLYQIGNSPFHCYMLPLMEEIPGTVVLHDFFMSGLMSWLELQFGVSHAWTKALYEAHGYGAVHDRYRDKETAKREYPVNLRILQYAQGVIVHSGYSHKLFGKWYGKDFSDACHVIPLLRVPIETLDKSAARQKLGFKEGDFIVCSFGFLDFTKLNHRLLRCWLESTLGKDAKCRLVFVGENHGGDYGTDLLRTIRSSGSNDRIRITGFVSPEIFGQYLSAADIAVQLRTQSRGETSAAVLDCMNYALPVIVNANGSMAELDTDTVWMLPDEFGDAELIEVLQSLKRDPEKRKILGERARAVILDRHTPSACAKRYAESIEHFHTMAQTAVPALVKTIANQDLRAFSDTDLCQLSSAIAATLPLPRPAKRLFLDISATHRHDLKTGIERVVRALLLALLESLPDGYRVEPVYLDEISGHWQYHTACSYTLALLQCPPDALKDEIIEPECGDILMGLDISGDILVQADRAGLLTDYRNRGVVVYFMVHDLLPVYMPEVFPSGTAESFAQWLRVLSVCDGAICVSKATADALAAWRTSAGFDSMQGRPYRILWSHHGADIINSSPSKGLDGHVNQKLQVFQEHPTFLMVGTIEPRKGYLQTIQAFDLLWQDGVDINLVIIGKEGWKDLPESLRRDIPETVSLLRTHPELDKRLFWLEGISDEYLEKMYASSTCLIAASYGEGFGLPLVEAAQHRLPILARDLPVFREVAGEHAYYFKAENSTELAEAIREWLALHHKNRYPKSDAMPWLTWKQSAENLTGLLLPLAEYDR